MRNELSVIVPGFGKGRALAERQAVRLRGLLSGVDAEVLVCEGVDVGDARNHGLECAAGDWIAWVDADDEVTDDWAAAVLAAIRKYDDVDGIVFDMMLVRDGRESPCRYGRAERVLAELLLNDVLGDMRMGSHLVRMVTRRKLWQGECFGDEPMMEDYMLLPRILQKARRFAYVPKIVYRYLIHQGSLSNGGSLTPRKMFELAKRRAESYGAAAVIGVAWNAYNGIRVKADGADEMRRWMRRNLRSVLTGKDVCLTWKLKFLLAAMNMI